MDVSLLHLGNCVLDAAPPNQISKIESVSKDFPSGQRLLHQSSKRYASVQKQLTQLLKNAFIYWLEHDTNYNVQICGS